MNHENLCIDFFSKLYVFLFLWLSISWHNYLKSLSKSESITLNYVCWQTLKFLQVQTGQNTMMEHYLGKALHMENSRCKPAALKQYQYYEPSKVYAINLWQLYEMANNASTHFRSSPSRMGIHVIDSQHFSVNISHSITWGIQTSSYTTCYLNLIWK